MINQKTVEAIVEQGPGDYIVLQDGDTHSNLKGVVYIDGHGTVWDLKKLVDRLFDIHRIIDPIEGTGEPIPTDEETMNALQLGYLDIEKDSAKFVRDDS